MKLKKIYYSIKKYVFRLLVEVVDKSVIIGSIIKSTTDKKNRVLFLVHRKELIQQIYNTLKLFNVNFSLIDLLMVQTACRRLNKIKPPNVIITDEAHHAPCNSYTKVYDHFKDSYLLGFTATPIRLNGTGLENIYNYMVKGPKIKWLIENKYLSPYKLYSVKLADISNLHIKQGDYKKDEVKKLMEDNVIYGEAIKNYLKLAKDKKTIVYCSSIESSIELSKQFNDNNIPSKHLDAKTPKIERKNAIQKFRDNKIKVLCNVDLFGEGLDVKDCECVILLRPTKSLSLYIQQSMRSMRYKENKLAIIIDHVGNCFEHGLPDQDREWSLKGKQKKENEEKIRQCPECFAVLEIKTTICPYCGYIFSKEIIKKTKEIKDVILEEITQTDILKAKPYSYYKKITTLKELIDFAEIKNYKSGWLIYKIDELKDQLEMVFDDFVNIQQKNKYKFAWTIHKAKSYNVEIPEKYNNYGRYLSQ
jgi:superfamily II DNA or RNA helicase